MKKWLLISVLSMSLGACSLLQGANESLNYVNEATKYINHVRTFSEEIPTIAEKAVSDKKARVQLEKKLIEMKTKIHAFNKLKPPSVAEDVHQKIIAYNKKLEQGINNYLKNIKNGEVNPQLLKKYEILQNANEITKTINLIKQIGS